jgi:uncharacterized membrane protein
MGAACLTANDIGAATIRIDRLIAVDRYADCRDTGSFILIDSETCDTVALGIIEAVRPPVLGGVLRLIRSRESHIRSIAKAVSWRIAGSLDTFLIAALITGSSRIASGVALTEVLTKTALYYVHERAWAFVPWGRR